MGKEGEKMDAMNQTMVQCMHIWKCYNNSLWITNIYNKNMLIKNLKINGS
jgi:hypothetical protein